MSFTNPIAFLGLLALIPLILMYMFKEHTRVLSVSSILFWQQLEEHPQPTQSIRLKRFLSHPLFWLQVVLILLIVSALAQPVWQRSARKIVLVVDISASMQTSEQGGTRLEMARTQAHALINELESSDRMTVVTMGLQSRILVPFTDNQSALAHAVNNLKAEDTSTNLPDALSLVTSLLDSTGSLDVVIISDQMLENVAGQQDSSAVRYQSIVIGKSIENTGFVALNQQLGLAGIQGTSGDLLLRNYVPDSRSGRLTITQENETVLDVVVDLPPSSSVPVRIGALPSNAPVTASFDRKDSLMLDNHIVFLPAASNIPTLLVTTDDPDFARVCRQLDGYTVTVRSSRARDPLEQNYDLYLYDRTQPESYPDGGVVITGAPGDGRVISEREIYDWSGEHPVLSDLVLERISLTGARTLAPIPPWASVLAQTRRYPVVLAGENQGFRRVVISNDLAGQLENPAALLLLLKSLKWVNPFDIPDLAHIQTGQPYIRVVEDSISSVEIISPTGQTHHLAVQNGRINFTETSRSGLYTLRFSGETYYFSANLLDPSESDIRTFPNAGVPDIQFASQSTIDTAYWRTFLWIFLVVMMVEWMYDFKRQKK